MAEDYARALWKLVSGGMSPARAVRTLHALLERDGKLALMSRIVRAFERIEARERARRAQTIFLAHEKDAHAKKQALEALTKLAINRDDYAVQTDDTLIGGWRFEGRSIVIDASFKKALIDVYNGAVASSIL